MPYKFNQDRRHKIPKVRYRVTNWSDYDAALVRRGHLTVWFTDEAGCFGSQLPFGDHHAFPVCIPSI